MLQAANQHQRQSTPPVYGPPVRTAKAWGGREATGKRTAACEGVLVHLTLSHQVSGAVVLRRLRWPVGGRTIGRHCRRSVGEGVKAVEDHDEIKTQQAIKPN